MEKRLDTKMDGESDFRDFYQGKSLSEKIEDYVGISIKPMKDYNGNTISAVEYLRMILKNDDVQEPVETKTASYIPKSPTPLIRRRFSHKVIKKKMKRKK